jgi:hypothetical protein
MSRAFLPYCHLNNTLNMSRILFSHICTSYRMSQQLGHNMLYAVAEDTLKDIVRDPAPNVEPSICPIFLSGYPKTLRRFRL